MSKHDVNKSLVINKRLDVVIGILLVLLIVSVGIMLYSLKGGRLYAYASDESLLLDNVILEEYGKIAAEYHDNTWYSYGLDEVFAEHYSIGKYYEAAAFYRLYSNAGDAERATKYKEQMEQYRTDMGEFQIIAEDIDEKLEREK